jgi:hypothetical protein
LGSYHPSCRQSNALNTSANKCAWNTAGHAIDPNTGTPGTAVPAAYGDYLVQVTGKYLVVQDLDIEDSAGRTLGVFPDPSTGANFGYCFWDVRCDVFGFVQRNKLGHTPEEGLLIFGAHNVVRQNEFFLTIMRYADRPTGFLLGQAGGSALVHAFCDPCYGLDEGNDFWGVLEAIGNYGVSAILERGNWGGSSSRVGYSANRNASMVFEQNIWVGGTADSLDPLDRTANAGAEAGATFWPFGNEGGAGPIALSASNGGYYRILTGGASNGDQAGSKIVRRNNVAQTVGERCFNQYLDIGGFTDQNPAQRIATTDVGNTCFTDLYTDYMDFTNNVLSQVNFYTAKNNLFVVSSSQSCLQYPGTGQFTFDYNQYTISPTGAVNNGDVCKSAHDVNSATTGLPGSFNWHTASWSSFPAESDFLPNNTDPGKAAGLAMTGAMFTYADPVWGHVDGSTGGGDSWWGWVLRQRVWLPACNVSGVQVTEAEWSKLLTTDYCGEARTTMTMGARNASP